MRFRLPVSRKSAVLAAVALLLLLVICVGPASEKPEQEVPSWGRRHRWRRREEASGPADADGGVKNPHQFRYIIEEPALCVRANASFVIFVTSTAKHADRRSAIRETWGSADARGKSLPTAVAFLFGNPGSADLQRLLAEESRNHGDIIQEDFVDSYRNLTLKSVMALRWASEHCRGADFLMKTDDDIFVNVPALRAYLLKRKEMKTKRWISGCIKKHVGPPVNIRTGEKAPREANKMSLLPGHPPFVAGAGYVISSDIIDALFRASLHTRFLPVEDVFITARCARAIGVEPKHEDRFTCGERAGNFCRMATMFTGHHLKPDKQRQMWRQLQHHTTLCSDRKLRSKESGR